jgi:hypothetical protein
MDALGLDGASAENSGKTFPTIAERGPGRPKEFSAETAAISGESKRSINSRIAIADALGDDLDKLPHLLRALGAVGYVALRGLSQPTAGKCQRTKTASGLL